MANILELGFNAVDIAILVIIGISFVLGMHRGFVSGVLSMAALILSVILAFSFSGQLASWLQGNATLVETLAYYTDAGSRIGDLDLSLLTVSQVTTGTLSKILGSASLPEAFETAFVSAIAGASGSAKISSLLSQTIVGVSISILSFLICFCAAYIVLSFLVHAICYVFELPVLRHLDALMGGVFGLARGVLLVFIFFALVPIVLAVAPIEPVTQLLEASKLAPIFDSRIILSILKGSMF